MYLILKVFLKETLGRGSGTAEGLSVCICVRWSRGTERLRVFPLSLRSRSEQHRRASSSGARSEEYLNTDDGSLMHISCSKAHTVITKTTNWTFTPTLIDLDKINLYYFQSLFCQP